MNINSDVNEDVSRLCHLLTLGVLYGKRGMIVNTRKSNFNFVPAGLSTFLLCMSSFSAASFCTIYGRCAVYSALDGLRCSAILNLTEFHYKAYPPR